jgi:hypothetical protein
MAFDTFMCLLRARIPEFSALTYIALSANSDLNYVNPGAYFSIQQSYYGKDIGTVWEDGPQGPTPWRYNPVQAGCRAGTSGTVLESSVSAGNTCFYSKVVPVDWVTCQPVSEIVMEQRVCIKGNQTIECEFSVKYSGTETHSKWQQESPAFFPASMFDKKLYIGKGNSSVDTGIQPRGAGIQNTYIVDNSWAAWTNDSGHGIGLHFPYTQNLTAWLAPGQPYCAPVPEWSFSPGMQKTIKFTIAIGTASCTLKLGQ